LLADQRIGPLVLAISCDSANLNRWGNKASEPGIVLFSIGPGESKANVGNHISMSKPTPSPRQLTGRFVDADVHGDEADRRRQSEEYGGPAMRRGSPMWIDKAVARSAFGWNGVMAVEA
jgi:hypothetical protein